MVFRLSNLNFNSLFGDADIEIDCPECNEVFTIKLSQVGSTVECPHCSVNINLEKDASFDDEVATANNALSEFDEALRNFGN